MRRIYDYILFVIITLVGIYGIYLLYNYVECSKPYKNVCVNSNCKLMLIYNPNFKYSVPITVCRCVEWVKVENQCYRG
jgi:hypothetical protein